MKDEKREETLRSRMNEIFELIVENVIPKLPEPIWSLVTINHARFKGIVAEI